MKSGIFFTGTGPILVLTTYEALDDPKFVKKLAAKGIKKFIAYEVDPERVKEKYGNQFKLVAVDLHEEEDLRVLDYDGHHVFYNFTRGDMGEPIYHEG
jgi:hypothetical protein